MKIQAIVALDLHFGIAKNNNIPWKCSQDMIFFRNMTIGNIVIMGYSTYLSLPNGPLSNRLNIVLTRKPLYNFIMTENLLFINSIQDIFHFLQTGNIAECYPFLSPYFDIFIIGGKQIYELFYPYIQTFWVSQINNIFDCDILFNWDYFLTQFSIEKIVLIDKDVSIYKYSKIDSLF